MELYSGQINKLIEELAALPGIGSDKDECEFIIDLKKVADKLGCDVSDFKQIDAQFGRLGQEDRA